DRPPKNAPLVTILVANIAKQINVVFILYRGIFYFECLL
ncbi:MAG: hypothetical protein ACI8RD_011693, partial [Bacillariaceae sp.]